MRACCPFLQRLTRLSGHCSFSPLQLHFTTLSVQELTAVRILRILGVEKYGVSIPSWQEHVSTPLRELASFGHQVRNRRKRLRAHQVKQEREHVQQHLESGSPEQFGVQSESLTQ